MSRLIYLVFSFQFVVLIKRKIASRFSSVRHTTPQASRGFSMIELLVSMALFIVVLTMGVGSLLVLISANARAQSTQAAISNVQFALDSMSREIRTGYGYYCTNNAGLNFSGFGELTVNDCVGGSVLSIVEGGESLTSGANNKRITYRYNSTDKSVERKIGSGSWVRLTDPLVQITSMEFNVINTTSKRNGNNLQPSVTIYLSGEVDNKSATVAPFDLQTTVTMRVLDL